MIEERQSAAGTLVTADGFALAALILAVFSFTFFHITVLGVIFTIVLIALIAFIGWMEWIRRQYAFGGGGMMEKGHQTLIHIGGDLSVSDMMAAIWTYAMKYDVKNPKWEERDRFVLSKGHAAAVTSFSQAKIGCYDKADIYKEYATDFGRFGMHSCNLANPYVDVSTGSLGHGLPVANGIAAALKAKGSKSHVYCVVGDGECGEGSIWEAALFAHHYKLGNLVVFVDRNKMSFDGFTEDYMAMDPFADKWRSFGWNVVEIDGHDMEAIIDAIDNLPAVNSDKPTVIIGNTVKGHGVSFMENNTAWHAGCVNEEDWIKAKAEITEAYERKWGAD